jgi:GNAT superfamily N-acetyltransferase
MVDSIKYQEMKPGEESEISGLVASVFMEFVAPGYAQEGVDEFLSFVTPEKIRGRVQAGESFVLTAKEENALAGIIEIKNIDHVALLFVAKKYHRQGIAKKLFELALARSCSLKPELREVSVNSSPYAVNIYKRLGFKQTGPEQVLNGIRFIPLVCALRAGQP